VIGPSASAEIRSHRSLACRQGNSATDTHD
jgi:hypothetical protein